MKKIIHFFKHYKHLAVVIISIIVSLALTVAGKTTLANIILGVTASISVIPLLLGMVQSIRDGSYGVDILAATAIIASVLLKEYWAGMIVVLMLTGGEALEDYAERRAKTELDALLSRSPKRANVIKKGKVIEVLASKVAVGDKLLIKPGELVPVDAVILEGHTSVDESSLTGESLPVERTIGDELLSGSVNVDGAITVKALRVAADSQYEQIIKLVKGAAGNQSPFVRLADRYSIPFTLFAYILAGGVWFASGDPMRFLQVIIVATPCPLLLAAPIALISGMSRAAKNGIIVKTGSALEKLAETRTIAFDKTGTLTIGQPTVSRIQTFGTFKKQDILRIGASLEQNSNHILAQAVVAKATEEGLKLTKVKQLKEEAGHGLIGTVERQSVLAGNASLLFKHDVSIPAKYQSQAATTVYIAIENQLAGLIEFSDKVRPEAKTTLARLKQLGIKHMLMVTGDNVASAKVIAKSVGISEIKANALPADKLSAISAITQRPVAFVGDGVNDAPVLTAAEVGIALGARGSAAASESADVVIMQDDLSKVSTSVDIAKRTFFIAKQSILLGIFISVGLMLLFSTGKFKPIYGAGLQELVDIAVIFNALRAHGAARKTVKQ